MGHFDYAWNCARIVYEGSLLDTWVSWREVAESLNAKVREVNKRSKKHFDPRATSFLFKNFNIEKRRVVQDKQCFTLVRKTR